MNVALWIVQALLAALFVFAGASKLVMSLDQMQGPISLPGPFLRFIGVAEVAGGLGLVLPWLFRIRPGLTPLAALGLIVIMVGAVVITAMSGLIMMAVLSFVVGALLVLVAYGRWRRPAPTR
jgi:uncharacterized membrane protein YphA (DoxX/SURF4 family)